MNDENDETFVQWLCGIALMILGEIGFFLYAHSPRVQVNCIETVKTGIEFAQLGLIFFLAGAVITIYYTINKSEVK